MPWVPIHQAFPDGTYYVDTGHDGLIPLADHPEFSLVNDRVVWEREAETLDGTDGVMQGYMPQVVFARGSGALTGVPARVTCEGREIYSWCNSESPQVSFCKFTGGSVDNEWPGESLGHTVSTYAWEYAPGATQEVYKWELGEPNAVELPAHTEDANALRYQHHCALG